MMKSFVRRWAVDHHLPGKRYGCITILDPDGKIVARMWADDAAHLELAKAMVAALNTRSVPGLRSED